MAELWYSYNSGNKTVSHDVSASSSCSHSSRYHDTRGGRCSVYFLLISTAHFHSFTARGVGSQFVVCVHSTPALSTMVQSLSRHPLTSPKPFGARSAPGHPDPCSAFVDFTAGIVKHKLSIIFLADHWGDKKHSPFLLCSLKAIMPVITLDISGMSQPYRQDGRPVLHQRCILEGPHSWVSKEKESRLCFRILQLTAISANVIRELKGLAV